MYKHKQGFTLVELIVVITILAILGTIAILAFSGYSKNARDSARVSDIGNMKKSLELWILQSGTYPNPTLPIDITYLGATVWTQGLYGDSVHQTVGKLDKKPLDPIYDIEYTYSVTTSKKEYQIGAVLEKDMATNNPILPQTYAAGVGEAYVTGNYNGVVTSTQTGGLYYMLAVPSIILSDINDSNLLGTKQFVLSNKSNLPSSYANTNLTMTGTEVNFTPNVVWSGTGYVNLNNQTIFQDLVESLQIAYNAPLFETLPEYTNIVTTGNLSAEAIGIVKSIVETNTNQTLSNVSTTNIIVNSCNSILPACNGIGCELTYNPINTNQSWVKDTSSCGFVCTGGYSGANCETTPITSGFLATYFADSGVGTDDSYNYSNTGIVNWNNLYAQTINIGSFNYLDLSSPNASLALTSWYTIPYDKHRVVRFDGWNDSWTNDYATLEVIYLDSNNTEIARIEQYRNGTYSHGIKYSLNGGTNWVIPTRSTPYSRVYGDVTITDNSFSYIAQPSGTYYINNFSFNADFTNLKEIKVRGSAYSTYSGNGGRSRTSLRIVNYLN